MIYNTETAKKIASVRTWYSTDKKSGGIQLGEQSLYVGNGKIFITARGQNAIFDIKKTFECVYTQRDARGTVAIAPIDVRQAECWLFTNFIRDVKKYEERMEKLHENVE